MTTTPSAPAELRRTPLLTMDSGRSQFGLRSLFIAITIFGVLLGLFRTLGIFGALLSFIAAVVVTATAIQKRHELRGFLFVFVWGVAMPLVCIAFDPIVFFAIPPLSLASPVLDRRAFAWNPEWKLNEYGLIAMPAIGLQITSMLIWLALGAKSKRHSQLFVGIFFVGMSISGGIGLALVPLSVVAIFLLGIGLMGFTPLLTATAYFFAMLDASRRAIKVDERWTMRDRALVGAGIVFAILLPLAAAYSFSILWPIDRNTPGW